MFSFVNKRNEFTSYSSYSQYRICILVNIYDDFLFHQSLTAQIKQVYNDEYAHMHISSFECLNTLATNLPIFCTNHMNFAFIRL